ncbi:unnamed protein product [Cylicocyclus nassatus]|uniref:Nonsense-mediated mRNA decay factor SMG8 n=1 Tax=Cylicocyclus nassatus TaxID=53992 RepID=A0AA36H6P7_CYLNA|nr:unnamed protein product [Cylicocyclus nassatus]
MRELHLTPRSYAQNQETPARFSPEAQKEAKRKVASVSRSTSLKYSLLPWAVGLTVICVEIFTFRSSLGFFFFGNYLPHSVVVFFEYVFFVYLLSVILWITYQIVNRKFHTTLPVNYGMIVPSQLSHPVSKAATKSPALDTSSRADTSWVEDHNVGTMSAFLPQSRQSHISPNRSGDSFGYVPESDAYVNVMQPVSVNVNLLSDILQIALGEDITEEADEKSERIPSFSRFLRMQLDAVRSEKSRIYEIPKLELWIKYAKALVEIISPSSEIVTKKLLNQYVNRQLQFMRMLNAKHVKEAIARYTGTSPSFGKNKPLTERGRNQVFTKAEHDHKVALAIAYLDAVLVGDRDEAIAQVRATCDSLWQGGMRGCEEISMTGNRCQLKVHATIGDASVPSSEWEMHSNDITYLSTCSCGRRQAVRRDPFTLKEANYDFYFENKIFSCCAGLEKHVFAVLEDDDTDADKGGMNWEGEGAGSNPLFPVPAALRDRQNADDDSNRPEGDDEDATGSETGEDSVSNAEPEVIESSSQSSQDDDVHYQDMKSYLDDESVSFVKSPHTKLDEAAIAFEAHLKKLRAKQIPFLEGVPHSLSPKLPPLFPSWTLTCIGPNSYYTYSYGLRDQPNLKLGGEYLYPVSVQLEVKLFVGMEYECPRGHRFFVAENGEPLRLPKNSNARSALNRESDDEFLHCDFPLRRQCTCKKLPVQTAQLMRVHVVTPKAPITVTIQPSVEIPGQEGCFGTGEGPLQLSWARYYILQLPFIYSGPSGVWIPPVGVEKVGTFKGDAIQVKYVPMLSRR